MPVYLCAPGSNESEPWKHGINVYQKPFHVDETKVTGANGLTDWSVALETLKPSSLQVASIRKIRHSEVVVADDVCLCFGRYWLRLRWPGSKGGFAGYVAMGKATEEPNPVGK